MIEDNMRTVAANDSTRIAATPDPTPIAAASDPRAGVAAWYLRERWRVIWHLPLTAGLALCLAVFILRGQAEDPRANIDRNRKAMLALAPPEVSKEENAAEDYWAADKAAKNSTAPASASYRLLTAGAQKKHCNFGSDYSQGPAMPLPDLSMMRGHARLLGARALNDAGKGSHAQAAQALGAIFAMSRHVEEDPLLICGLVGVAMCAIACETIEQIVAVQPDSQPLTFEELQAYRNALWLKQSPDERLVKMLEGERAFGQLGIDQIALGTLEGGAAGLSLAHPESFTALWYGPERRCHGIVLDVLIAKVRNGETLREEAIDELIRTHQSGPSIATTSYAGVFARCQESFRRSDEKASVVDAALAFLQFRSKHGRDAAALDELVPEFLAAVPKDPFHALPLKMRVDEAGRNEQEQLPAPVKTSYVNRPLVRIYSCGQNGKDDGGLKIDSELKDDAVFVVPRLAPLPKEIGK